MRYDAGMLRRLFDIVAAISLVLAVLTAIGWATSYDGRNAVVRERYVDPDSSLPPPRQPAVSTQRTEWLALDDGEFIYARVRRAVAYRWSNTRWQPFTLPSKQFHSDDTFLHRLGISAGSEMLPRAQVTRVMFPLWFVQGATLMLPGCWYWIRLRRNAYRMKHGLCVACGCERDEVAYDICHNCGTPIPEQAVSFSPNPV